MRRLASILLLLAFAGSGTGGAAVLHRLQHAVADEHAGHVEGADADAGESPHVGAAGGGHHADDCRLCADLRASATADRWDPHLVPAGASRAPHQRLAPQRDHVALVVRIETTGPPTS